MCGLLNQSCRRVLVFTAQRMKVSYNNLSSKCYQIRYFQFPKLSMTHLKLVQSFGFIIHKIDFMSSRLLMFFLILGLSSFTPCSSVSIVNFEYVNAGWDYSWYMSILKRLYYIGTYFSQKYQTFLSDNFGCCAAPSPPSFRGIIFFNTFLTCKFSFRGDNF